MLKTTVPLGWHVICRVGFVRNLGLAVAISAGGVGGNALAAGTPVKAAGQLFQFKDWEVACDNTRRCQVAGYLREEGGLEGVEFEPVALLLTREAGPQAPVEVKLIAPTADNSKRASNAKWQVLTDTTQLPAVSAEQAWPAAIAQTLMTVLPKLQNLGFRRGKDERYVSLSGLNAALLKMDDVQGRVGTPGALLRKGDKPESAVLPPLPAPEIRPVPCMAARKSDAALIAPILAAVKKRDCWDDVPSDKDAAPGIVRLSETRVMVTRLCWQAAYQSGRAAWVANSASPYNPEPVKFPAVDGKDMASPTGLELLADGTAMSATKGRGIGDCWETTAWAWTGQRFELTQSTATAMCRQIPGGVPLRLWTSRKN